MEAPASGRSRAHALREEADFKWTMQMSLAVTAHPGIAESGNVHLVLPSPQSAAAAFFIGRATDRADDSLDVAAVLERMQAQAADDAVGKRALFHPGVEGPRNHGQQRDQDEGT